MLAALFLSLYAGTAQAQQTAPDASTAALDRMIAAGKSQREVARHLFDTRGCNGCHTIAGNGKLGLTQKGQKRAEGFEGCVSTLKAMTVIAKVPENRRSDAQRLRARRFEEFGCSTCHRVGPDKQGLTDMGAKLANLHLGCVDVQRVLAGDPGSRR
jgi:hypothetical protein